MSIFICNISLFLFLYVFFRRTHNLRPCWLNLVNSGTDTSKHLQSIQWFPPVGQESLCRRMASGNLPWFSLRVIVLCTGIQRFVNVRLTLDYIYEKSVVTTGILMWKHQWNNFSFRVTFVSSSKVCNGSSELKIHKKPTILWQNRERIKS